MQLRRYLEFAVVVTVLGVLAWVLRARFDAIQAEARSVQLRMAAEAARSNAQLLQLKCPDWADRPCTLAVLAGLRRAALPGPATAEVQQPAAWPVEPLQQRLYAIAFASGLADSRASWHLRPLGAEQLEVALQGVNECRFVLHADIKARIIRAEDIQSRC
ncbi:hypothetical protein [Inhella proteolytica]|uniref:Uncharacterized protein n=1 Tax=Inhella proteolytica TaxID=2795029 RepID=A0A931J6E6_9BURK|nr:hypothetical protein [Inhella proteolytica]MBH9579608.1 hypothetical protein [Inhella proteolytica]